MGTWDDGLYDNDAALDTLGGLMDTLDPEPSAAHFVGTVALLAQLSPVTLQLGDWGERIRSSPYLPALSEDARVALEAIAADPEGATAETTRTDAQRAALGSYCEGRRIQALFDVPGVTEVVKSFESRTATALDAAISLGDSDLYESSGDFALLGVLIELETKVEQAQLAGWQAHFDACDKATDEERDFFDDYAARVRKGLALLAAQSQ